MKNEILRISKKLGLTHIGSCLSILSILKEIYSTKESEDIVGLSGAHAHLAHLMFLRGNPEKLIKKYGIHCDRKAGCDITGGSLGHSGIAIGMALADGNRDVYWIETDGSLQEGSAWEALRIKRQLKLDNLKIYVNMNGFTAVAKIDKNDLTKRLKAFCPNIRIRYTENGKGFNNVGGHYKKI